MAVLACVRLWDEARTRRLDELAGMVSARNAERLARALRPEDANRSAIAELLVRRHLQARGHAWESTAVSHTATGSPMAPALPDTTFSISHSGRWIVCAFSRTGGSVGVDVEEEVDIPWEPVAARFHPLEQALIAHTAAADRRRVFYDLWTRKEARLKAGGQGLTAGLDSFSVLDDGGDLVVRVLPLEAGYCLSVCVDHGDVRDEVQEWTPDALMAGPRS